MSKLMKLKIGENRKCTNKQYHADREFQSSSGLKLVLYDDVKYYLQYKAANLNTKKKFSASQEFGSLIHTLLLEPENLNKEYVFWNGKSRRGKEFKIFASKHEGKMILTSAVLSRAKKMTSKLLRRNTFKNAFRCGRPEVTACQIINGVKCKARFDYIDVKRGRIIDIKSTRWRRDFFGLTQFDKDIDKFSYWFSAALYIRIAEITYGKKFEFVILAVSKDNHSHHVHVSKFSKNQLINAQRKLDKALEKYKEVFDDSVIEQNRYLYDLLAS